MAIHELLLVTDEVRDLISRRAPDHEIRKVAKAAGMRTLLEDGISKAAQGLTTLDEVLRVVVTDGSVARGEGEPSRKGAAAPSVSGVDTSQNTDPEAQLSLRKATLWSGRKASRESWWWKTTAPSVLL
jgi:hypothetical protein